MVAAMRGMPKKLGLEKVPAKLPMPSRRQVRRATSAATTMRTNATPAPSARATAFSTVRPTMRLLMITAGSER